ncbi:DUF3144 domain-containing protein [Colwellia sp. TT2012]|uniref:DUF3144 domain-containing protein n=1 Tax=Colwellia sp. TT2012 TaxID=1720342 RepID=UPI00070E7031|nr:DUF3144 domain-containing protein [Colwellia sp. TT2012]
MSQNEISDEFWQRADEYIELANNQSKSESKGKVGASLLYASARFSAFDVASSSTSAEEMKADKDEAISFYVEQFRKMITDNMDEYIENFKGYKPHG